MSTKKQREVLRRRRMEFDKRVYENRDKMEKFVKERKEPEETKKKRGRPKKKVE